MCADRLLVLDEQHRAARLSRGQMRGLALRRHFLGYPRHADRRRSLVAVSDRDGVQAQRYGGERREAAVDDHLRGRRDRDELARSVSLEQLDRAAADAHDLALVDAVVVDDPAADDHDLRPRHVPVEEQLAESARLLRRRRRRGEPGDADDKRG